MKKLLFCFLLLACNEPYLTPENPFVVKKIENKWIGDSNSKYPAGSSNQSCYFNWNNDFIWAPTGHYNIGDTIKL